MSRGANYGNIVPTMIGFVPRTPHVVIPLRVDVKRAAIVQSVPRDRVLAAIAAKLYALGGQGAVPRDAYIGKARP